MGRRTRCCEPRGEDESGMRGFPVVAGVPLGFRVCRFFASGDCGVWRGFCKGPGMFDEGERQVSHSQQHKA